MATSFSVKGSPKNASNLQNFASIILKVSILIGEKTFER
jgi:hypothetical protein